MRRRASLRAVSWLLLLGLAAAGCARHRGPARPLALWLYYGVNLAAAEEVTRLEAVWRRAAASGYRHIMLADPKLARLGDMDEPYFAHLRRVRDLAAELGLEVVPCVFQVGRSSSMLARHPDLAEGLPVRDARFVVRDGVARIDPDPPVAFGGRPDWIDPGVRWRPEIATMRDPRFMARFMYRARVRPFGCYRVSVRVKSAGFTGRPLVRVVAGDRPLHLMRSLGVAPTQDWTLHHLVFNSLDHDRVDVHFGVWGSARGTLEWRDWAIEELGPINVLRRPGTPFVVKGHVEGRDFEPVRDSLLGADPWPGQYREWHEPPVIRTRLPEGTVLSASWHHAAIVYEKQVTCCLSDSAVYELLADEARRVRAAFGDGGRMMMHDEIRVVNQDALCHDRGRTPGQLLADHARRCVALLPGSTVHVWSDMFDPYHNAVRDRDLVNGDLSGAWEGLDPKVVIVNWNAARRDESLRFFAARGHRQLIAAYYDGEPEDVRRWLDSARGVEGVEGVMYTTWRGHFDDLEAFARACRADR
jgi:hypothetical protein